MSGRRTDGKRFEHAGALANALERMLDEARRREGRSLLERDTDFETSARFLVGLVAGALNGIEDPGHATWLARRFEVRRKREWARVCELAFDDFEVRLAMMPRLIALAPEAAQLSGQHVVTAFRNTRTASGFAASLAVACAAFGYTDQHKAKKAFENLQDE